MKLARDRFGKTHTIYELYLSPRALGWEWFVTDRPERKGVNYEYI